MQRGTYDAVTEEFRLPVLVRAKPEEQEGLSTFEHELGPPFPVRIFKNSELKDAHKHLTKADAQHFRAVVDLIHALKNPSDTIALKRAKDGFEEVYKAKRDEPSDFSELGEEFANALAKFTGQSPREAVETLERKRPGPRAAADPRWLLSYEVSEMLNSWSRLVRLPNRKRATARSWQLPGTSLRRCWSTTPGLRLRRTEQELALSSPFMLPSAHYKDVGVRVASFRSGHHNQHAESLRCFLPRARSIKRNDQS